MKITVSAPVRLRPKPPTKFGQKPKSGHSLTACRKQETINSGIFVELLYHRYTFYGWRLSIHSEISNFWHELLEELVLD